MAKCREGCGPWGPPLEPPCLLILPYSEILEWKLILGNALMIYFPHNMMLAVFYMSLPLSLK